MLNSHYTSQTNVDTFTTSGRTDLLSRVEDRNLFLAECLTLKRGQRARQTSSSSYSGAPHVPTCASADMRLALIAFGRERAFSPSVAAAEKLSNSIQNSRRVLAGKPKCELGGQVTWPGDRELAAGVVVPMR